MEKYTCPCTSSRFFLTSVHTRNDDESSYVTRWNYACKIFSHRWERKFLSYYERRKSSRWLPYHELRTSLELLWRCATDDRTLFVWFSRTSQSIPPYFSVISDTLRSVSHAVIFRNPQTPTHHNSALPSYHSDSSHKQQTWRWSRRSVSPRSLIHWTAARTALCGVK